MKKIAYVIIHEKNENGKVTATIDAIEEGQQFNDKYAKDTIQFAMLVRTKKQAERWVEDFRNGINPMRDPEIKVHPIVGYFMTIDDYASVRVFNAESETDVKGYWEYLKEHGKQELRLFSTKRDAEEYAEMAKSAAEARMIEEANRKVDEYLKTLDHEPTFDDICEAHNMFFY